MVPGPGRAADAAVSAVGLHGERGHASARAVIAGAESDWDRRLPGYRRGMTFEAPSDHTTLAEVLAEFEADGYTGAFEVEEDGAVRCLTCDRRSDPDALDLFAIRRLEGASDPADMAAVLATRCAQCAIRGVIVAR